MSHACTNATNVFERVVTPLADPRAEVLLVLPGLRGLEHLRPERELAALVRAALVDRAALTVLPEHAVVIGVLDQAEALADAPEDIRAEGIRPPAIIVIGDVAAFAGLKKS